MSINKGLFGKTSDGKEIYKFTLKNKENCQAEIINYGGIITSLLIPDKKGNLTDVALGYSETEDYINNNYGYFGAIIGRCSNRIENGEFEINNKKYQLYKNDGNNHLHGGEKGFDKVLWDYEIKKDGDNLEYLELSYVSKDGEEGYPGILTVKTIYKLTDENSLVMEYYAQTDEDTIINMTNHTYFNLKGHDSGDVLDHKILINADFFTKNNNETLPNGEIVNVVGTPLDFRSLKKIGDDIKSDDDQIKSAKGFDVNYVINGSDYSNVDSKIDTLKFAAKVVEEETGRVMEVYTTKPGIQFYSGNHLRNSLTYKNNAKYDAYSGFCLETQYYPNSTQYKHFTSPLLKKGEKYQHKTVYKFYTT